MEWKVNEQQVVYILDSFVGLANREAKQVGEYRSKNKIIEMYQQMMLDKETASV